MRRLALYLVLLVPLSAAAEEPKLLASLSPPRSRDGFILSLAFTADGATLAAGLPDSVHLWHTANWKLRRTFPYGGMYLSFSRDGRSLAIGYAAVGHSRDQPYTAVIMEVSTGRPRCTVRGAGPCQVALSPNGRLLATWRDRGLQLWDAASGKEVDVTNEPVGGFCFSPDGGLLAIGLHRGGILLWDVVANRRLAFVDGKKVEGDMMFSGTGDTLALRGAPKSIRTWDVTRRREQLNVDLDNTVRIFRIALSYDGTTVAVARESFRAEGFVELLDATTGKELLRLKHHTQVVSVAFSPDGKLLALGDIDNTVQVWKLPQLRR